MKFWKYGRVVVALIGAVVLGLSITCCGVYTSGYMYVTGAQYNQIAAYKIDHDFGYLTAVTGSPFPGHGSNPVQELVLPGGRFLATVNKGSNDVSIYTIGGAGRLFWQYSYPTSGKNPVSIGMNSSGNYIYVVDQNAPPDLDANGKDLNAGRGDITVFQVDPTTGKLTVITNQNTFNTNGSQLPYFAVNYKPVQIITAGGGSTTGGGGAYVYVLDQAYAANSTDPSIPAACQNAAANTPCTTPDVFLYLIGANGQLTLTQNSALTIPNTPGGVLSTIYSSTGNVYIANTSTSGGRFPTGSILPFTVGPGGVLQTLVGGTVANVASAGGYPDAILANSTGQFLYVANFGPNPNSNQPSSNITSFSIDPTNHQLTPLATSSNLNTTGSGPIWMAQDSTNQYLYTVNFNDNTISAKTISASQGVISNIVKGTAQTHTIGQPTFVVVSGRTF